MKSPARALGTVVIFSVAVPVPAAKPVEPPPLLNEASFTV